MAQDTMLEEFKKAYMELMKEDARKSFIVHLAVYILVNIMLAIVNLVYTPETIWFHYPLIGWGIGVTMHYLFGVRWIEKEIIKDFARAEYMMRKARIEKKEATEGTGS
ncbi:2TM domain-containing protein [Pyrodictium abyssi]